MSPYCSVKLHRAIAWELGRITTNQWIQVSHRVQDGRERAVLFMLVMLVMLVAVWLTIGVAEPRPAAASVTRMALVNFILTYWTCEDRSRTVLVA